MSTLRVTILGCGSSGGVPRATGDWGACDPNEPKNRRTRGGAMLQQWRGAAGAPEDATTVLIDTPTDLRLQLAAAKPARIDAVLFSHDHADQTHGIDDVRAYFLRQRAPIAAYMDAPTRKSLLARFGYCFNGPAGYPAILRDAGDLTPLTPVAIDGPGGVLRVTPIAQDHGGTISLGFRAGPVGYSNDVVAMPEASFGALDGLALWIVDALREKPHPTHAHLQMALDWIALLKPARAVLTNLTQELDYQALKARLPDGVEPAYDGWSADFASPDDPV
jgi:phosphoribosyl 1,2-cyclic phosphate phosphodiesterase